MGEPSKAEPTLHEFASEWIAAREAEGLAEKTLVDLRWSLSNHLLPHFAGHRLSEISPQEVDRFKVAKVREREAIEAAKAKGEKVRERGLSNGSINHVLSDLAQVLETAVEYGLIQQNPAAGKRRRLKAARPNRPWVEPEQLMAFLDAARGENGSLVAGRVLLALLAGGGLRIGEALALRWSSIDLAVGTLHVTHGKTDAATRSVDLTPPLREELTLWKAAQAGDGFGKPGNYVITNSKGHKQNPSNLRRDVLAKAIEAANAHSKRTASPRSRRLASTRSGAPTRASAAPWATTCATPPPQLGHEDPRFTLRPMRRRRADASGSQAPTAGPTIRPSNGHKWAQTTSRGKC